MSKRCLTQTEIENAIDRAVKHAERFDLRADYLASRGHLYRAKKLRTSALNIRTKRLVQLNDRMAEFMKTMPLPNISER